MYFGVMKAVMTELLRCCFTFYVNAFQGAGRNLPASSVICWSWLLLWTLISEKTCASYKFKK